MVVEYFHQIQTNEYPQVFSIVELWVHFYIEKIYLLITYNYPEQSYIKIIVVVKPLASLINPFMPTVAFNMCCPRDCVCWHNGGTSGAPIMPRAAVSRTANVERNGGHKWVKVFLGTIILTWIIMNHALWSWQNLCTYYKIYQYRILTYIQKS